MGPANSGSAAVWLILNVRVDQTNHWQIVVGMIPISSVKNPRVKEGCQTPRCAAPTEAGPDHHRWARVGRDGGRRLDARGLRLPRALPYRRGTRLPLWAFEVATDVLEVTPQVFEKLASAPVLKAC